ncbi:MAG: outer membrane protein assembly factor BamD [Alphaproteobacteria bacterium]|nr:outer membrane protein assembly factor BamD [Alphaproteobacteria bacterium]
MTAHETYRNSRERRLKIIAKLAAIAIGLPALASCQSGTAQNRTFEAREADQLYNSAVNALESRKYPQAVTLFEEVERQHPYSLFATKAQLMSAYASYADQEFDGAINALDRYIELHPGNRDISYAYYLRALSYYDQIADVRRDQRITERAVENLEELVRRFPDSDYARDASVKLDLARDHLAGKEMEVGRFYLQRKNYTAAINRFQNVVDRYDTTTHVPEALHRLVEAFTAIGLINEAQEAAAVLGHNYPGSEWYLDSYELVTGERVAVAPVEENEGILSRMWPF